MAVLSDEAILAIALSVESETCGSCYRARIAHALRDRDCYSLRSLQPLVEPPDQQDFLALRFPYSSIDNSGIHPFFANR